MSASRRMYLGAALPPSGGNVTPFHLDPHHLVTHGVIAGMTGIGKTGLLLVLVEEALRSRIPVIIIDVKGDLPNTLLAFPSFDAEHFLPWVEADEPPEGLSAQGAAEQLAAERKRQLEAWELSAGDLRAFSANTQFRVLTPGSSAGESLHLLSALERRSASWGTDPDAARSALSAAVSLVLRLVGREPDPAKSREHVLLSVLAERRTQEHQGADLAALVGELLHPPIERIGALSINAFLPARERQSLAAALNTLLASPTFAAWRQGASFDIKNWLAPANGRTPAVIVSVAHLDDEERRLVLGLVLEEIIAYARSLPGSRRLRALVVFDEVYGFFPPHPANPPTKRPLLSLIKQGRAFGVGTILATQNPMDLDYRALSNSGFWAIGRLQTEADRQRVVESITSSQGAGAGSQELMALLRGLAPRWFLVRDVHAQPGLQLLQPRWALSHLRGPMTQSEIRRALGNGSCSTRAVAARTNAASSESLTSIFATSNRSRL